MKYVSIIMMFMLASCAATATVLPSNQPLEIGAVTDSTDFPDVRFPTPPDYVFARTKFNLIKVGLIWCHEDYVFGNQACYYQSGKLCVARAYNLNDDTVLSQVINCDQPIE